MKHLLLIIGLFGVALAVITGVSHGGPGGTSAPATRLVTVADAEAIGGFLSTTLKQNGRIFDSVRCKAHAGCFPVSGPTMPTYAWRLLGWSGLYRATKNPDFQTEANADFKRIIELTGDEMPLVSLHQVYEGWKSFHDPEMAAYFYRSMHWLAPKMRTFKGPKTDDVMTMGTISRQLWLAQMFSNEKEALAALKTKDLYDGEAEEKAFDDDSFGGQATRLTKILEASAEVAEPPSDYCFAAWNLEAAYRATGQADYKSRALKLINIDAIRRQTSTQMALPCVDALARFAADDDPLKARANDLLEWFKRVSWDSKTLVRCQGDNGFLSVLSPSDDVCREVVKDTSDNGWAAFILATFTGS